MSHQYKAGDAVTVFQISPSNELVIEGKATIRKRVAEIDEQYDEQYRVEFADKPGVTYERFVDSWGQDDPGEVCTRLQQAVCAIAARHQSIGKIMAPTSRGSGDGALGDGEA